MLLVSCLRGVSYHSPRRFFYAFNERHGMSTTVTITIGPVDWKLLREQKAWLADIALNRKVIASQPDRTAAEGLLILLDAIQDQAAIQLGPKAVFGTKT